MAPVNADDKLRRRFLIYRLSSRVALAATGETIGSSGLRNAESANSRLHYVILSTQVSARQGSIDILTCGSFEEPKLIRITGELSLVHWCCRWLPVLLGMQQASRRSPPIFRNR